MLFNVYSISGKILGSRNDNKVFLKPNLSTSLPSLHMGGMGDPHMMLRMSGGGILARWDDNAPGSQNSELLFLHIETNTDTVSVFYKNSLWGTDPNDSPKTISSVKYIHNGITVSGFVGNTKIGPVRLVYTPPYDLYISTDYISNIRKFGGGASIALAASANANNYVDGGWGRMNDGYANLASGISSIGTTYTRNDLVVGSGTTIDNSGNVTSPVMFNTTGVESQRILGFVNSHFSGAIAAEIDLPLNPVALQLANILAPGGNFDGLVNPPSITGGIIDASGNTGSGLNYYGADGMPSSLSYVGTYSGTGGPTGTSYIDPYFDSVTLLLHANNNFSDSSSYNRIADVSGSTTISSGTSRFGAGSIHFESNPIVKTGPVISYTGFPTFGSSDFTIECWIKPLSCGSVISPILGKYACENGRELGQSFQTNWLLAMDCDRHIAMYINYFNGYNSDDAYDIYGKLGPTQPSLTAITTGTIPFNHWRHIAAVRNSNDIILFINGQSGYKGTFSGEISDEMTGYIGPTWPPNPLPLTIGGDYYRTAGMSGYLDEIRVTHGVARYTSNFTPPTLPFPSGIDTVYTQNVGKTTYISWD